MTIGQISLDDVEIGQFVTPDPVGSDRSLQARFWAFHEANPWVYVALVQLSRSYRSKGHQHVGIAHLFEVLRWRFHQASRDAASSTDPSSLTTVVPVTRSGWPTRAAPDMAT